MGLSRPEVLELLVGVVRRNVAVALAHESPEAVDIEIPFSELGFDSLSSVELRRKLGEEIGRRLPATLLFDRPTVAAVAEYLVQELAADEPSVEDELRDVLDRLGVENADENGRARVSAMLRRCPGSALAARSTNRPAVRTGSTGCPTKRSSSSSSSLTAPDRTAAHQGLKG